MEGEIERNTRRIAEIDTMIEGLYEANVLGKITDERFSKMRGKYEAQQKTLVEETKKLESALEQAEQDRLIFVCFLKQFVSVPTLKSLLPKLSIDLFSASRCTKAKRSMEESA